MKGAVFALGLVGVLWWSEAGHGGVGADVVAAAATSTTAAPVPTTAAPAAATTAPVATTTTAAPVKPRLTTLKPMEPAPVPVIVRGFTTCAQADRSKVAAIESYVGPVSQQQVMKAVGCDG